MELLRTIPYNCVWQTGGPVTAVFEEPVETGRQVPVLRRKDFLQQFASDYRPGQHVTFLGPSGRGKTTLMGEMLTAVLHRQSKLTAVILHGKIKGRDDSIVRLSKKGFPITTQPSLTQWDKFKYNMRKPKGQRMLGYIIRPLVKPMGNSDDKKSFTEQENNLLRRVFARAIYKCYHAKKKKPVILVVDEAHQAHVDLGLKKDCEGPLMRGRPVCGEWSSLQRGRYASQHVYDQAEHVLIFYDPVKDNQERYGEIGGVDPKFLIALSRRLKTKTVADGSTISQCIYFRRSGDYLAIVDT